MRLMGTLRPSMAGAVAECAKPCGVSTNIMFSPTLPAALRPLADEQRKHGITLAGFSEEPIRGTIYFGVRRSLTYWNPEFQRIHSPILRYGFAVVSVAVALGVSFVFQYYEFREVELPVLTVAIALTTWYAGNGPAMLAVLASSALFDYFFTEPLYSLNISTRDLPYFLIFLAWAAIVASFSAVRRRIEDNLRQTTDNLQVEVEQRRHREEEIRKLNQELGKRAAELQSSNHELESFAYSVSHDLRAPLRHMVGYSELLQKQASSALDEKSQRFIQTILNAAKKMGNLIDDLLAFSRIGRAETNKTKVDLKQLVDEVVAEIGQDTRDRDIAWKIGALPVCYGDRSMLRLVVVNLIANAVKFSRLREAAEIEIGCNDRQNGEFEVFVRDNGAGFDMQYVNKLFGVFQRLHLPEQFEGTGIGLATVQRVIHRHGGQVRGEGALDQGATFYFSLPKIQYAPERTADAP
jgi:signal transduction histidine kinase